MKLATKAKNGILEKTAAVRRFLTNLYNWRFRDQRNPGLHIADLDAENSEDEVDTTHARGSDADKITLCSSSVEGASPQAYDIGLNHILFLQNKSDITEVPSNPLRALPLESDAVGDSVSEHTLFVRSCGTETIEHFEGESVEPDSTSKVCNIEEVVSRTSDTEDKAIQTSETRDETAETHAPDATAETQAPDATEETQAPDATEESQAPDAPAQTQAPDALEETQAPDATEESQAPDAPEQTQAPDALEKTQAPDATEETQAPDATEETQAPDATDETQAPDATEETQAPDATEETQAPDATEQTQATDATEEIQAPDAPEGTEAPDATDVTSSQYTCDSETTAGFDDELEEDSECGDIAEIYQCDIEDFIVIADLSDKAESKSLTAAVNAKQTLSETDKTNKKDEKTIVDSTKNTTSSSRPQKAEDKNAVQSASSNNPWSLEDFRIGRPLGKSKLGQVLLAREKRSKYIVVLRILQKSIIKNAGIEKHVKDEINLQSQLNHPNILRQYGYFNDNSKIYVIQECVAHGCLLKTLRKCRGFDEATCAHYLKQVIVALMHFHAFGGFKRDIRPETLLLDPNRRIKIADFGCGFPLHPTARNRVQVYMSPEELQEQQLNASVDLWSLGVLLFELITGRPPFSNKLAKIIRERISTRDLVFFKRMSDSAKDLIGGLLRLDPTARLSLAEVLEHRWMKENLVTPASDK